MRRLILILIISTASSAISNDAAFNFVQEFLGLDQNEVRILKRIPIKEKVQNQRLSGYSNQHGICIKRTDDTPTLVHELIHQAFYQFNQRKDFLVMEGAALLGEYLFIKKHYDKTTAIRSFSKITHEIFEKSSLSFSEFKISKNDYGKSFLLFLYLYENFYKKDFIHSLFRTYGNSFKAIEDALLSQISFRLTPKSWKRKDFILSTFFWSLINHQNMLSINHHDEFNLFIDHFEKIKASTITKKMKSFSYLLTNEAKNLKKESLSDLIIYGLDDSGATYKKTYIENLNDINLYNQLLLINLKDHSVKL